MKNVYVLEHPLIADKLTVMRAAGTGTKEFRELLREISICITYEMTRDLPLTEVQIETPIAPMTAKRLGGKKLVIVPVLRAGLGMSEGFLSVIPTAKVGHIGLYRDHNTKLPVTYYCNLPKDIGMHEVIVADPMLATGGSAVSAITLLREAGCECIRLMCVVSAPEGLAAVHEAHPDVKIYTAAVDKCLNEHAYIVPGLGDAGDRLFGTM